ncbi:helix-turn-helix domain-containing protein [Prolixibacteraceae bacterium Z1-6]|uniref:Helix-turn-helix domain-containing protein n=1 Tax=Draconibacterium aestuarii TaxID=2998507 RepID=A0A9X3J7F3_9BACT|nr:helix-turn-helix domain-containing protein [Prolixibacteraceae bacterium Z1-6]
MTKTILIIGFVQSLFGILLFLAKRPKHLSFSILTIWLCVNVIFLGAMLLPFQVVDYFKPGIFPVLFLFGPLLYFYVSSLTLERFKFKAKFSVHLIPLFLVSAHRLISDPVSVTSSTFDNETPAFTYNKIYFVLLIISMFVYWVFSVKLILSHRKNIPFYFSNYSQKNTLTWLIFVVLIFLLFFVLEFFFSSLGRILNFNLIPFFSLPTSLTVFSFIIIFFGINQSVIYKFKTFNPGAPNENVDEKYKRSALSEQQINEINKQVYAYLKDKKPYLNPEFSLQMMVDDLGISRQNLSQVINAGQQKNFYQLINGFRLEEVKTLLNDPAYSHYTILGIALECGFNSKTSFNRIFKEETGLTPTQFKRNL